MKTKKAALGAAHTTRRLEIYTMVSPTSRANVLDQAADVLCLLVFFPLSETARTAFTALLQRRLCRAYGGLGNG